MLNLSDTLAALETAEAALRQLWPAGEDFDHEVLTLPEATRLSLLADECHRIRVDLLRYFDPRNRQQEWQ